MTKPHTNSGSARISPTAHITGQLWVRNQLAPAGFSTREGRLWYQMMRLPLALSRAAGGPSLEAILLARHRVIDHLLTEAIEAGRISQVVEVAAGLSGRGTRFAERYGNRITYIETDLPGMAARKQALLKSLNLGNPHHQVRVLDATADSGAESLAELATELDRRKGLAIITEGLLNYLDQETVEALWTRFASVLAGFDSGLYLSDLHLSGENRGAAIASFGKVLGKFVKGRLHMHYPNAASAEAALVEAGFASGQLHRPINLLPDVVQPGAEAVRVIQAEI